MENKELMWGFNWKNNLQNLGEQLKNKENKTWFTILGNGDKSNRIFCSVADIVASSKSENIKV